MMNTPRARATFTTSFRGPAISPTRRAADLHQWSSHMSQMMSAVFFGSHATLRSATLPSAFARERRLRYNAPSAANAFEANTETARNAPIIEEIDDVFMRGNSGYRASRGKTRD